MVYTKLRNRGLFCMSMCEPLNKRFAWRLTTGSAFIKMARLKASSETQGQIVGARESLNGWKNMARRKVKNGEKSPWRQCLTRPVPNGRRRSGF